MIMSTQVVEAIQNGHTKASGDFDPKEIAAQYTPTTGVHKLFELPLVQVTAVSIKGYGHIVESPEDFPIEIVRWPAQGWRPVDEGSGDQGGITEGLFEFWWKGDTLYARNNAVGDSYLFGWSQYFPKKPQLAVQATLAREL